jgi:hypothetical protein
MPAFAGEASRCLSKSPGSWPGFFCGFYDDTVFLCLADTDFFDGPLAREAHVIYEVFNMKQILPPFIQDFIFRRLNTAYLRKICLIIVVVNAILIAVSFITNENGRTIFGPHLGADFASFYIAGSMFSEYGAASIYDRELHTFTYHNLFPDLAPDTQLPYANPPFFVIPFVLLAKLPYTWAYFAWLLISLSIYVIGLLLLEKTLDAMPAQIRQTMFLAVLAFMPFLTENLAGGQVATVGFLCLAAALYFLHSGQPVLSGMVLAVCLYKPTLLILFVPMLFITRQWKIVQGFLYGFAILVVISLLAAGWDGCVRFVNMLVFFVDNSSTSVESGLRTWKYVDINSFFRLAVGGNLLVRWALVLTSAMVMLPILAQTWLKFYSAHVTGQSLIWALTITWTLVLNLYVGIYDSILVMIGVILTIEYLYRNEDRQSREPAAVYVFALIFITPWFTQTIALTAHVQIYTLALAILGIYQITLFQKAQKIRDNSP